jgi:methylated-DNA-protein-cysteine methyltransferase related protein
MNEAEQAILDVVSAVPRGRVTTYGGVAERAGWPRRARLVGRVLSRLPAGSRVPWHRVVAAGGRIAFPDGSDARRRQVRRLRAEGVEVRAGRVDLARHGWGSAAGDLDRLLWGRGEN